MRDPARQFPALSDLTFEDGRPVIDASALDRPVGAEPATVTWSDVRAALRTDSPAESIFVTALVAFVLAVCALFGGL